VKVCFKDTIKLFKDQISEREQSYENISIKESLLLEGGEIPKTWLARYSNNVTWKDLPHACSHCDQKFKSLCDLLLHFEKIKLAINRRSIKCTACDSEFKNQAYLASYINHVDKSHYNHLKFGCVFCDKIFYNVMKLCQHGIKDHSALHFKIYPCIDCGLVCSTIEALTHHKNCHDMHDK
jgi:transposase